MKLAPRIDPEFHGIARQVRTFNLNTFTLPFARFGMDMIEGSQPVPGISIEETVVRNSDWDASMRLLLYRPWREVAPTPLLLWLHGGGYVMGKPELDDALCCNFVRELGITVASVDYRLAPRYPFPHGLEDAYTALQWLHAQSGPLNLDPNRIAVGGQNAGAGLAAALTHLAYDRQEIPLAFQLLIAPMLDSTTGAQDHANQPSYLRWSTKSNRFSWKAYLGQNYGSATIPPYAVPARRDDLAGLPPAWIGVGDADLFYQEDAAYAQRLAASGVDCEFVAVPGAFQGFDQLDPDLPSARKFRASQLVALDRHLAAPEQPANAANIHYIRSRN